MEVTQVIQIIIGFLLVICQSFISLFIPKRPKDVKGQLALITGGSKGIGKAIAVELASKGCNIAVVGRDMETAERTATELQGMGVKVKAFKADVGRLEEVEKLKVDVERELGPVDILVNNAGFHVTSHLTVERPERIKQMMDTNLVSNIWVCLFFFNFFLL